MADQSIGFIGGDSNNIISGSVAFHEYKFLPSPYQLPPLDTYFVGREEEVAWLLEQLHPGKVITICGTGGMGKSALAAQAVHKLEKGRFPDGIIFHSFYHQPKTETALQAIAEAFQIERKASIETAMRTALSGKKALLILDGAEEADDLQAVLKLRGSCGVLITSRRRIDAVGARIDLAPLSAAAAEELLRAWSGDEGKETTVQRICNIIGNHPSAIRVAGRYLRSTGESAADYLRWLEKEPFKKLSCSTHQSENVALLLRRSVAQVSDNARLVMGLAGALAFAPISGSPVAAILDDDELRCRDALNELVNYGLLERRDDRWQASHAMVHTYARSELTLSREKLERLAAYYISFCKAASEEGVKGYARLDGERAHCLRLIESCLTSKLWQAVQVLSGAMGEYLDRQGWWTDQLAALEMRLTAARQAGDRRDEGWCLNELGYTCERLGEYEKALAYYEQSLPIYRELGDRQGEGVTLNNIAVIYRQQGRHELALEQFQQSLTIAREIGDREGGGRTLTNIGGLYYAQGNYETALQYYEQSLPVTQEVGYKIGEGTTLNNIAAIYRAQGKPAKALEYHEQALAICQQLGDRAEEAVTRWNIGLTCKDIGDLAKAEEYISQAVQIMEPIGHPYLEQYREGLARVRAKRRA